jgi:hypothetical protein
MILNAWNSNFEGHWKRLALKIETFWALKWQRAKRVPFGPKNSSFSGPAPSNGPSNGSSLKIIKSKWHIKKTGKLVILLYVHNFLHSVFCIPYSVFFVLYSVETAFFFLQCVNTASPLINIHSRISPRIFEKIRNGPDGPGGNWFMKKTWSLKSRVNLVLDSLEAHACAACSTTAFYYGDFSKLGLRPYTVYTEPYYLFAVSNTHSLLRPVEVLRSW